MLLTLLCLFGNALGSGPHLVTDGARQTGRLFVVVVGKSSKSRKGTSLRNIKNLMERVDSNWFGNITSGLSSGEGLIEAANRVEPDKRLLVVEEEFARTLAVKGREQNTLSAVVRQAWDDGNLKSMTKNPLEARDSHVSLVGHITIAELRQTMQSMDMTNGFGNRFLWCWARRAQALPSGGCRDDLSLSSLVSHIGDALDVGRQIGELKRSLEAEELWEEWYLAQAEESEEEELSDHLLARAEAQVTRLALIYAALDRSLQVDLAHLQAALAVWNYCAESVRHIFQGQTGNPVADRILAELIRRSPQGIDRVQQSDLFQRHLTADKLQEARDLLLRSGRAVEEKIETGGHPRYLLGLANQAKKANL